MSNKNSKLVGVGSAIIIALIAVIAWLAYDNSQKGKELKVAKAEMDEAAQVKVELEKEYYEALNDLEEMRGDNTELNALLEQQKEELKKQKNQISGLIKNRTDLASAKQEIENLRLRADKYLAELTEMKEQNEMLAAENKVLSEEKELLTDEVNKERAVNDELLTIKASLSEANETLSKSNDELNAKVTKASVVQVNAIDVQGFRLKGNGKEAKKNAAEKIDLVKICFNANENNVVAEGNETFYIRIINPLGETMAIEDMGSGIMQSADGQDIRYTQSQELAYSGDASTSCVNWQPNTAFAAGDYAIEIYNKGHLAGQSTFALK